MPFFTKKFLDLSLLQLHEIYKLRSKVFVVEQNCAYQDVDDKDPGALHVMMFKNDSFVGYSRLLPPGISHVEAAIGRVVLERESRGQGLGAELMKYSIGQAMENFKVTEVLISAQCYLDCFYRDLGFVPEGEAYLEDNIPHIKMRYSLNKGAS